MPFIFSIVLLSARFIVRRFALPATTPAGVSFGFLALGLALTAEILFAVAIQKQSLGEAIASRFSAFGTVLLVMLVITVFMPHILMRVPK